MKTIFIGGLSKIMSIRKSRIDASGEKGQFEKEIRAVVDSE
jgi:hypothetical protein